MPRNPPSLAASATCWLISRSQLLKAAASPGAFASTTAPALRRVSMHFALISAGLLPANCSNRPYAQLGTCGRLATAIGDAGQNYIVERELTLCRSIVDRERQNPPVGQPDTPRLAFRAGRFLQHGGTRPVHVIKWHPCSRERPLPCWPFVARPRVGFDALNGLR